MNRLAIIAGAVFLVLFVVMSSCFVIVNAGYVGVVKRLGAVQPNYLSEGFHVKMPILDTVEKFDIRLNKFEAQAGASSKDLQVVRTSIAVQYSMTPELMPLTLQKVGTRAVAERTLIAPSIMESVKAITALYTAEELITRRDEVKTEIQSKINSFLTDDEKIMIIEMIWKIVIADGRIDDYENALVRKISGLLYIDDFKVGEIKKKLSQ